MAKFMKGQVAGSGGSARSGERDYTPRLNEIDTDTRENRGDKRKSSVEVLPASTAIINVYQLVDKVSPKGKKAKLYYPGGVPGVGFVGFKKLRGIRIPREEAEVVMPQTPPTPKVTTASQGKQSKPTNQFAPSGTAKREDLYIKEPYMSRPPANKDIKDQREYYVNKYANNQPVLYQFDTDVIGHLRGLKSESDADYQKRDKRYRDPALESKRITDQSLVNQVEGLKAKMKQAGSESKKAVEFNTPVDKKNAISLITREKVHYTISGEPYANNSRYVRRSVTNPEDLKIIIKAITNARKLGTRLDEKPYPIVAVGTNMNSPSTTHDVYISGGLGNFEARRKKPMHTKAKRNMKKIPNKKHRVVMKKKGGRK